MSKMEGYEHIVSYENTDRLKHEVAFYNPHGLNPNEMLNAILDEYFRNAKRIRTKSPDRTTERSGEDDPE